jgi:hypothetical protein
VNNLFFANRNLFLLRSDGDRAILVIAPPLESAVKGGVGLLDSNYFWEK